MNNVILTGRLVDNYEPIVSDYDKKYTTITIAIPRNYKNVDGIYETDFIDVVLYGMVAESTCEYCRKGDLIGVKGRLETQINTNEDGHKTKTMVVVAERVSFLSSKKESE